MQPVDGVISWDENIHVCQPGDTYQKISAKFFQGHEDYAQAIQQFNRNHYQASDAMKQTGALTPGEKVFVPPVWVLEKYGAVPPKAAAGIPPR